MIICQFRWPSTALMARRTRVNQSSFMTSPWKIKWTINSFDCSFRVTWRIFWLFVKFCIHWKPTVGNSFHSFFLKIFLKMTSSFHLKKQCRNTPTSAHCSFMHYMKLSFPWPGDVRFSVHHIPSIHTEPKVSIYSPFMYNLSHCGDNHHWDLANIPTNKLSRSDAGKRTIKTRSIHN